jgi:hypothetical protein
MYTSHGKARADPLPSGDAFKEEIPLYAEAGAVVDLLRNLPPKPKNFSEAFVAVYNKLYESGITLHHQMVFFKSIINSAEMNREDSRVKKPAGATISPLYNLT